MSNYNIKPPSDIKALAAFLAERNSFPENHIGYCGEKENEILDTLLSDFSDLELKKSFAIVYLEENIVGAIGLDVNISNNSAEVWGPFASDSVNFEEVSNLLLNTIRKRSNLSSIKLSFFINEKNLRATNYVKKLGAEKNGRHLILKAFTNDFKNEKFTNIISFNKKHEKAFSNLHKFSFPRTYYSAEEIIARLNSQKKIFVSLDIDQNLNGYVYLEANPDFGEGSIEYIAVDPNYQRQGIGVLLVRKALSSIFDFENIKEVSICVGVENKSAINLYKASGFKIEHELTTYDLP